MTADIIEQNRVTAGFTLKLPNEVQYGSNEATLFVPLTIPEGASEDDIEALAQRAMGIAKRVVAGAMGVEADLTIEADGTETVELQIAKAFPGAKVEPKNGGGGGFKKGGGGGKPKSTSGGGGRGPSKTTYGSVTVLNQIDADVPDWLEGQFNYLVEAGDIDADDNEVWDNRKFSPDFGGTGNANAPWFKTSKAGRALDFGGDPVEVK